MDHGPLGVECDAFRAEVRTPRARAFIAQYSMAASASFTLAVYGEHVARLLAEYWTSKMCFIFECWEFSGGGAHVFSDAEVAVFVQPDAFSLALPGAQGRIKARMVALQELRPNLEL